MRFYPQPFIYKSSDTDIDGAISHGYWLTSVVFCLHYCNKSSISYNGVYPHIFLRFSKPLITSIRDLKNSWVCEDVIVHWDIEDEVKIAHFLGIDESFSTGPLLDEEFKGLYDGFIELGKLIEDSLDGEIDDELNEF